MSVVSHFSRIVDKVPACGTALLCLLVLIIVTAGATQSYPVSSQGQSATVAHCNGRLCFENLDLQCETFLANYQAFHVIANPHRPKVVVSFMDETRVDSRRHNRPPPRG